MGARLDEHAGFGRGFSFLRHFLAVAVIAMHTSFVLYGLSPFTATGAWLVLFAILPMFFALGGFLVSASADRLPLGEFVTNRGLRIFPAMGVEILLAACILGPAVTSFSWRDYFGDPNFAQYFLSVIGWVQFDLPGVFLAAPLPNVVNGSLWTVPQDLAAYLLLACLIFFGLFRRPRAILGATLLLLLSDAALQIDAGASMIASSRTIELGTLFVGTKLIASFFCGCALYKYRYHIPFHPGIALSLGAGLLLVGTLGDPVWAFHPLFRTVTLPVLAYLTILLGHMRLPPLPLPTRADYSYGIYLYGFPIQQTVTYVLPGLRDPLPHFLLSMVIIVLFAAFSWHCVERPLASYRKRFSYVAEGRRLPSSEKEPAFAAEA